MRVALFLSSFAALASCQLGPSPENEFWGRVNVLCGHYYSGELTSEPVESDQDFARGEVGMDVRACSEDAITIDLMLNGHVQGTWQLIRHEDGLELRHHHDDGLTGYGGYSTENSSGSRMNFPADATTKEIFRAADYETGFANVWAMEARSGVVFAYELSRPERFFRLEFDTTNPVERLEADADTSH